MAREDLDAIDLADQVKIHSSKSSGVISSGKYWESLFSQPSFDDYSFVRKFIQK